MKLLSFTLALLLAALAGLPTQRHVFPAPGSYPVTLTVCNRAGCSSKTETIRVLDPRPTAPAITLPPKLGSAQQSAVLLALASGRPPLRWEWTIARPGRTLRLNTNPATWTFDALGVHQVKVTVRNPWGFVSSPSFAVDVVPSTFQDVSPTLEAFESIETLAALGLAAGCSSSPRSFCPDRSLTRAETAVQIAATAFGPLDRLPPATGLFDDVPLLHWAAVPIEHLARSQITPGCSSTPPLFCPDRVTTRAEAATFLVRAARGPSFTPPVPTGHFLDVPPASPAAAYIEQLARDGVTEGCSLLPPMFCPQDPLTRAQLATFLVRLFQLSPAPTPLFFAPKHCPAPCAAAVNTPLVFRTDLRGGIPTLYEYDWAGDGVFEEASPLPVLSHTYKSAGTFSPALRIRRADHVAQIASPPLRIAPPNFPAVPTRPTGLSAAFRGFVSPSPEDPPGTLRRAGFVLQASSMRAVSYNVYFSVNGSPFQLVDCLPAAALASTSLRLPVISSTDNATLQLRPINPNGVGPSSLNLRLSLNPS